MHGLKVANIDIDRKILADLAVNDEDAFRALTDKAKLALEKS
jgi:large subunit ribosomal protein L20